MIRPIVLGLVQGVTEFLPISSSGHLVLFHRLLGYEPSLTLDVLAHIGTLIAIAWFFRKDLVFLGRGLLGWGQKNQVNQQRRLLANLILASGPVAIIGLLFGGEVSSLANNPTILAICFWITALLLVVGRFFRFPIRKGRFLAIGLFQALAIVPGISRSASTVVGARVLGEEKEAAFKFSFLLGLIAIGGAAIYEIPQISQFSSWQLQEGLIVVLVSFLSGLLALRVLKSLFLSDKMWYFSFYCFFLGLAILVFFRNSF